MPKSTAERRAGQRATGRRAVSATLLDARKNPLGTCSNTPNGIAKAFMEVPAARFVRHSKMMGGGVESRSAYKDRMDEWNEAQSNFRKAGQRTKGRRAAGRRADSVLAPIDEGSPIRFSPVEATTTYQGKTSTHPVYLVNRRQINSRKRNAVVVVAGTGGAWALTTLLHLDAYSRDKGVIPSVIPLDLGAGWLWTNVHEVLDSLLDNLELK